MLRVIYCGSQKSLQRAFLKVSSFLPALAKNECVAIQACDSSFQASTKKSLVSFSALGETGTSWNSSSSVHSSITTSPLQRLFSSTTAPTDSRMATAQTIQQRSSLDLALANPVYQGEADRGIAFGPARLFSVLRVLVEGEDAAGQRGTLQCSHYQGCCCLWAGRGWRSVCPNSKGGQKNRHTSHASKAMRQLCNSNAQSLVHCGLTHTTSTEDVFREHLMGSGVLCPSPGWFCELVWLECKHTPTAPLCPLPQHTQHTHTCTNTQCQRAHPYTPHHQSINQPPTTRHHQHLVRVDPGQVPRH